MNDINLSAIQQLFGNLGLEVKGNQLKACLKDQSNNPVYVTFNIDKLIIQINPQQVKDESIKVFSKATEEKPQEMAKIMSTYTPQAIVFATSGMAIEELNKAKAKPIEISSDQYVKVLPEVIGDRVLKFINLGDTADTAAEWDK